MNLNDRISALNKTAEIMREDTSTPVCRTNLVCGTASTLLNMKITLEACRDLTVTDDADTIDDLRSRLESINKNLNQILA